MSPRAEGNGGKGGPRGPVALFTITRVSLATDGAIGGAVLENSFLLRENLIRSAVGPACIRFEITFTRPPPPPAFFFPAPRGHGAVIKARRVCLPAFLPVCPVLRADALWYLSNLPLARFPLLSSSLVSSFF